MKWINILQKILYGFTLVGIVIGTYDFFNDFRIRKCLMIFFCGDTVGDCHFKVEELYGIFHYLGSFIFLIFNQSKLLFIIGQLITLLIYCAVIWLIIYLIKIIYKRFFNKSDEAYFQSNSITKTSRQSAGGS